MKHDIKEFSAITQCQRPLPNASFMCIAKFPCKGRNIFSDHNHKFGTVLLMFVLKLYGTRDLLLYSFSSYTNE